MKRIIAILGIAIFLFANVYLASGAEFLIYNKDHWMDALTQEQLAEYVKKYPKTFMDKYNGRMTGGDVVEVRPDGYWTGTKAPGYDKSVFLMVSKPGLSFKDAKYYGTPLRDSDKIVKKRKYNFSNVTDKQVINDFSEITITEKRIISAKEAIHIILAVMLRSLLLG